MLNKKHEKQNLDTLIDNLTATMAQTEESSDEYSQMADQLEKLHKTKNLKKGNRISAEALLAAGANLAGIILIIHHEQVGVITTKALGFVQKVKF